MRTTVAAVTLANDTHTHTPYNIVLNQVVACCLPAYNTVELRAAEESSGMSSGRHGNYNVISGV